MYLIDLRTGKYLVDGNDTQISTRDNIHLEELMDNTDPLSGSAMGLLSSAKKGLTKKEILIHLGNGFDLIVDGKKEVADLAKACEEALPK